MIVDQDFTFILDQILFGHINANINDNFIV